MQGSVNNYAASLTGAVYYWDCAPAALLWEFGVFFQDYAWTRVLLCEVIVLSQTKYPSTDFT